ncbi:MAG: FadR family transcriptional regulator [Chloroflexi bacterium]|nr:MAG: FadR family transcriptional regulator [Chloroflexota bacterium]
MIIEQSLDLSKAPSSRNRVICGGNSLYTPVQSIKVFEQIADQIEQRILNGELRSGDRLPTERVLAEQFQASRTAVREAMKILAQKGLVEMRPGRGTIVINGAPEAMQNSIGLVMKLQVGEVGGSDNLVEVREILETEIAALAAARATEDEIAAMREAIRVMDVSLSDADAYIAADNQFHRALAKATQNSLILILIDSIVNPLSEQRKHIFAVEGGPERGQFHHRRILESIIRRNPENARAAMHAHLQQVREDVRASPKHKS